MVTSVSMAATVSSAHTILPSQESPPANFFDQIKWALLQKLPTREDFEAALQGELTGLKQDVPEVTARVSSLETDTITLHQSISSLQVALGDVSDQVAQLLLLLDNLENHNRRCNIRICGLPKATPQTGLKTTVTAILNQYLERPPETNIVINRVHRTLGPRNSSEDRPRDVFSAACIITL